MNPQDMLDYALGRLDGSALQRAEREIERDASVGSKCERVRQSLWQIMDDGADPSGDLRSRTMRLIAAHPIPISPVRPRPRLLEYVPRSVPFRFSDLAVAAGIFLAGVVTLLPALHRGRVAMQHAGCLTNLREIGRGLGQYAMAHRSYPQVAPGDYSAIVLVRLQEDGLLSGLHHAECPCVGPCNGAEMDSCVDQILHPNASPDRLPARCDYAFNVGYRQAGQPVACTPDSLGQTPLVADQPSYRLPMGTVQILEGNSPNHGGRGQNVLYADQSVRWHRLRNIRPNDRDVFLNDNDQPSFGLHKNDSALIPGVIKVPVR